MSATELKRRLRVQSQNTGISVRELRRLCTRAGLERLEAGQMVIGAVKPQTLSIRER